ncbi:MAG: prepilin-type N-terminal cleavage/methylation domain-containing protein [Helicobacteraceae bacterium]|nr:prepilin-type N-terminal cleavage/methylation domain-containing protein [Helicobacteraceae bacterium]
MKKAFTMLELVFVIVVIGVLAAAIIPRMDRDNVAEATIQLQSHIRYTQHLAMVDDKYDATNPTWFRNRWQIRLNTNGYSVVSDNSVAFATNPQNSSAFLQNINLNNDYGVTLTFTGSCAANQIISFDHLGRPMAGDLSLDNVPYVAGKLLQNNCVITVADGGVDFNITIHPETGYVQGI